MQHEDRIRLQHMLDAGQEALAFAKGHVRNDLYEDRILLLALVKCIEIIGEAAGKVSDDLRTEAQEIPLYTTPRGRYGNASTRCGVCISASPAGSATVRAGLGTR